MAKIINKNNIIFSLITGIVPALFTIVGYVVKHEHGLAFSLPYIGFFILIWLAFSALSYLVYGLSDSDWKRVKSGETSISINKKKEHGSVLVFWISFAVLMIIWTPSFLAFYPGIFAYDNQWQYFMYVTDEINTHQPLMHTLILGFIISKVLKLTGSINKGVALYTLFQMIMMGLGLAYIPYLLKRKAMHIAWIIFSVLFFALYSVIVIFVFTGTKDSLFSVAVVDFIALNFYLLSEKNESFFVKKYEAVLWAILSFVMLTFRGNTMYALIPIFALIVIYVLRHCKKKKTFFISLVLTLSIFFVFKYPITNMLVKEYGPKSEMMSVPCQQLSRIYHYHYNELDKSDIGTYDALFDPILFSDYYVPEIADASKGSLRMEVYENQKSDYWKLWFKWFKEYPKEYVDSILENTYGYFYMWPSYVLHSYGRTGYTVIHCMAPAEPNSKIPALYNFYEQFEDGDIVMRNGLASWVFAPATYLIISYICIMYVVKNKRWKLMIPFLFLILLWGTFLLGPVALVRYNLFFYMLVPFWPMVFKVSKDN